MKYIFKNNILKGASVLLITMAMIFSTISATANTDETQKMISDTGMEINRFEPNSSPITGKDGFTDSFESYDDFTLDFPPWTQYDGDEGSTWAVKGYTFPNQNYVGSFIIMNPSEVTEDPGETPFVDVYPPHSGDKYAACFNAVTDYAPNDDWLFTPSLTLGENGEFSFWGRSINDNYGLEKIEVGISTTDTDPSSFSIISEGSFDVPAEWTEYIFDLSAYNGNDVYIGIHVISPDVFAFLLDDILISGAMIPEPDLDCDGSLSWTDVTPGGNETGSFTVKNNGESGSLLNWRIEETPDWGEWIFSPSSGGGLTPESGDVIVEVSVVAPDEQEQTFDGEIKIVNTDDSNDYCIIQVSLVTPKNKAIDTLFYKFLENHPQMFPIIRHLLGL